MTKILILIVIFFIIPLVTLLFARGRFSLFSIALLWLSFCIYSISQSDNFGDADRFGFGRFLTYTIFLSTILGFATKSFIFYRKRPLNDNWAKKKWILLFFLIAVALSSEILGYSGVCLSKGRKLTDAELTENKGPGFYRVREARRPLFGNYRANVDKVKQDGLNNYTETFFELDACGNLAAEELQMGESDFENWKRKYSKNYVWRN